MTDIPKNLLMLIDGDILLYRCGFAAERQKYLVVNGKESAEYNNHKTAKEIAGESGIIWTRREVEPVENAFTNLNNTMESIFDALYTDKPRIVDLIVFLTGKGNFRETLATRKTYKDNRDPAHRPKHYRALKERLVTHYKAHIINGEEADDAIGKAAYERAVDKYVIVSNDKDLDQLSGFHYDWTTKRGYFVTDEEAIKNFYVQLLAGDSTDNIPGAISEGAARKIIEEAADPHGCAVRAKEVYEKKYGQYWGDWIEEIGELVWIRRGTKAPDEKFHNPFWNHLHQGA